MNSGTESAKSKKEAMRKRRTHFDPPPQARSPESPMREAPIRKTTTPVTMGGKIFLSLAAGTKDMPISSREQSMAVKRKLVSLRALRLICTAGITTHRFQGELQRHQDKVLW